MAKKERKSLILELGEAIRKTITSRIPDIGKVNTFPRSVHDVDSFKAAFQITPPTGLQRIRHWLISPSRITQTLEGQAIGHAERTYGFLIQGWQASRNGNVKEFIGLAEEILNVLESEMTLDGKARYIIQPDLTLGTQVMLGEVLCDYCEITIGAAVSRKLAFR